MRGYAVCLLGCALAGGGLSLAVLSFYWKVVLYVRLQMQEKTVNEQCV